MTLALQACQNLAQGVRHAGREYDVKVEAVRFAENVWRV